MNEFTIGKRMITITIDEDMFNQVYDELMYAPSERVSSDSDVWKFFHGINKELNG